LASRRDKAPAAPISSTIRSRKPGTCHYEFWVTRFVPGDGYANFAASLHLEPDPHAGVRRSASPLLGRGHERAISRSAGQTQSPVSSGLGIAIEFNGGVNLRTGDLDLPRLVPVTIPVNDKVR
jgi:hypothetical protein